MGHRATIMACLLVGVAGCSPEPVENTVDPSPDRAVSVAQVAMRPIGGTLTASGELVPLEEAAVAAQVSGYRVTDVLVDEGDMVRMGQPLARLDPALIESRIAQARAQLAQAEATAGKAEAEARRVAGLDGTGVVADEQIAERRAQAKNAAAGADAARAQVRDLLTQRAQMVVRAPVSGIVLERTARPGAMVSAGGDALFRIARGGRVELDAEVTEDALPSVVRGTVARVSLPSGVVVDGTVRLVSPRIDPKTRLGRARITLPVSRDVRAGGSARAEFHRVVRPVLAVPEGALHYDGGGATVMVVDRERRVRSQPVRIGVRADGWVQLLEGPSPGTTVALGGAAFLLDGDTIQSVAAKSR